MPDTYSLDALVEFLGQAAERGLLPRATATALAVACRNVLGVLSKAESEDLTSVNLDDVVRRFQTQRANDFRPHTVEEYGRRTRRAVQYFIQWRKDPDNFHAPTRTTASSWNRKPHPALATSEPGTFQTSVPVGRNRIVTLLNVPADLTKAEASRIAAFVEMLAVN